MNPMKDKNQNGRPIPEKEYYVDFVADILDVSSRTIKNWEKNGWIPKARRNRFNWRIYTQSEIDKIVAIVNDNKFFTHKRSFATTTSGS